MVMVKSTLNFVYSFIERSFVESVDSNLITAPAPIGNTYCILLGQSSIDMHSPLCLAVPLGQKQPAE